ncbi:DUF92 domain-containing protein [Lewinella sp. IMCC34191]|uniref:DUF92 domain-containing protein n=1 Tax=Lewinella sp. IMCC34191 TaxID=2259172 RepID=UPI001300BAB3|nr:DUF92 domain-containing protein [Lewinella sp. IMCC34191]
MESLSWTIIYGVIGVAFAVLTVRRGSLTKAGAGTALALGTVTLSFRGAEWLFPLLIFFLSSVIIGRALPASVSVSDEKDKMPRDAVQVACNGAVYGCLAVWGGNPMLLLVVMATATSDTWSSEIGKHFRQPTFDITTGRRVPPGLSGGISVAGTIAGLGGAALIALLGYGLIPSYTLGDLLFVITCGFGGMLLDSLLGASFQARYRGSDGAISDRPSPGSHLASGFPWMTNDTVNLLSITLVALVAWFAA